MLRFSFARIASSFRLVITVYYSTEVGGRPGAVDQPPGPVPVGEVEPADHPGGQVGGQTVGALPESDPAGVLLIYGVDPGAQPDHRREVVVDDQPGGPGHRHDADDAGEQEVVVAEHGPLDLGT